MLSIHHDQRGTVAVEYLLIMAAVVFPLALAVPLFYQMIRQYTDRIEASQSLPF